MPFIRHIYIYPVKSLGAIECPGAFAAKAGFNYDRRWMLVDSNHNFVTQRTTPLLSQFACRITDSSLVITYQQETLHVPLESAVDHDIITQVWDDTCVTQSVGSLAEEWFSDLLGKRHKLVKLRDEYSRQHMNSKTASEINVSLADGYPYLILGEGSLDHLNDQLLNPVSLMRFRPNIVVADCAPHDEDHWTEIRIGEAAFQHVKLCARCQVIQIDPETSTTTSEPTKTLSTYRKQGHQILFGSLYTCQSEGWVSVGDQLEI